MKHLGGIFNKLFGRKSKKGETGEDKGIGQAKDPCRDVDPSAWDWIKKGLSLVELGKHDDALRCYEMAIQIDPIFAGVWTAKGSLLLAMDKHEEALRCYDKAIELCPSDKNIYAYRNICLVALGRLDRLE